MSRPTNEDYIAICEVKARYCRCLDEKDWAGYAEVYTQDVRLDTRESGGPLVDGRDAVVAMVRGSIGDAITVHQVHSPEISMVSANEAQAIFAMQDRLIWSSEKAQGIGSRGMTGFGHYRERYRRCDDGRWRISYARLTRLHIETDALDR